MFRARRNRRRVDLAQKTGEMRATVKRHSPSILKSLGVTAVTAALVSSVWQGWGWATTSERFALRTVRVRGNTRVTDAQIWKLGGLAAGQNIFALDGDALERSLLAHPWVKSVSVRRVIPDELNVDLTENVPVALLALPELYFVDADGEPFKRVQASEPVDLPLITGIEREALVARREQMRAQVRLALEAIEAYAASQVSKGYPLSEVRVSDFGLTLVTTSGQEVVLGTAELASALERLNRVRRELASRKLSGDVIRLDNRSRPNWVAVQTAPGRAPDKVIRTP